MTQVILYTSEDGKSQIQLRADGQTVWLTQMEMAELFSATKQNISLHLKNVFADGELSEDSVVKDSLTTAADGKRYQTRLYNLDAILAVGYRVRSPRGTRDGTLMAGSQGYARLPCIWRRRTPILRPAFNMGRGHRLMHDSLA